MTSFDNFHRYHASMSLFAKFRLHLPDRQGPIGRGAPDRKDLITCRSSSVRNSSSWSNRPPVVQWLISRQRDLGAEIRRAHFHVDPLMATPLAEEYWTDHRNRIGDHQGTGGRFLKTSPMRLARRCGMGLCPSLRLGVSIGVEN